MTWTPQDPRTPTIDEVVALARDYYAIPENIVGGSFHIVLDDGNIEDGHVDWCRGYAHGSKDRAGSDLGDALARLSEFERESVYDRYDEYRQR